MKSGSPGMSWHFLARGIIALTLLTIGMAVQAQPRLFSWGYNGAYRLGDGTSTSRQVPGTVKPPVGTSVLGNAQSVAVGTYHTVAARTDGTAYAWGYNNSGQLGNNTTTDSPRPVQVQGPGGVGFLTNVQKVSANQLTSFALLTDGTVWGWGYNAYGQLGDNSTDNSPTPVQVRGPNNMGFLTGVTQISAGAYHTLALKSDGTVWGWGYNGSGGLGQGDWASSYTPVQVKGPEGAGFLTNVVSIAAGLSFSLAVKSDGTVWAWGSNNYNQLGDGTLETRYFPVQVLGPGGVGFLTECSAVAASDWHALALKSDGAVYGWGWNAYGQVGDNSVEQRSAPAQVVGINGMGFLTGIQTISCSYYHSVAVRQDGSVWSWGYNGWGQFGDGATDSSLTPVQMRNANNSGPFTQATAAVAGYYHVALLREDGGSWTCGYNGFGQLGSDSNEGSSLPIRVISAEGEDFFPEAQTIVSRGSHTVVLKADGTVYAYGSNVYGQLGDGTTTNRSIARQVVGPGGVGFLTNVIAISAGDWNTVALKEDGTVWAWGWNGSGALGDNTTTDRHTPVQVRGPNNVGFLTNIIAIAAGPYHTLALRRDGAVFGWGAGGSGELGTGNGASPLTPVQMLNQAGNGPLTSIVGIAAGLGYSLALGANGGIYACGANSYGQLGDGTTDTRLLPVRTLGIGGVGTLNSAVAIAASNYHAVALYFDGTALAWGQNNYGQLGDNTTTDRLFPVRVKGPGGAGLLTDVASIAAGAYHTLAGKFDGTVFAWGYNAWGQLGDNTIEDRHSPVQVLGVDGNGLLGSIVAIAAADAHSVVLKSDGAVQGSVILQNSSCSGANIRFEFRPVNGTPFTRTLIAGPMGLFTFTNIPPGEYDIAVKGSKWLQRVVHVNTTSNNILNLRIFLLTGDADDSNSCDVLDLDLLIQAFDTLPGDPNWNEQADFNCDESVDVLDLDLLIQNFDLMGDP